VALRIPACLLLTLVSGKVRLSPLDKRGKESKKKGTGTNANNFYNDKFDKRV
jgi:hypothetical protein